MAKEDNKTQQASAQSGRDAAVKSAQNYARSQPKVDTNVYNTDYYAGKYGVKTGVVTQSQKDYAKAVDMNSYLRSGKTNYSQTQQYYNEATKRASWSQPKNQTAEEKERYDTSSVSFWSDMASDLRNQLGADNRKEYQSYLEEANAIEEQKKTNQNNLKGYQQAVYTGMETPDVLTKYNEALKANADYDKRLAELKARQTALDDEFFDMFALPEVKEARARLTEDKYEDLEGKKYFNGYKGNIDLFNRDTGLRDENGKLMTVDSIGIEEDGKHIVIPTVVNQNGKWVHLSEEDAINWYHKTGEHLGIYKSQKEADEIAKKIHEQQDALYGDVSREKDQARVDEFMQSIGAATQYYNFDDRLVGGIKSGEQGVASSLVGAGGTLLKVLNAYGEQQAKTDYDKIYGSGAYDKMMQESGKKTTVINGTVVPSIQEIQSLQTAANNGNQAAILEMQQRADTWVKNAGVIQDQIDILTSQIEATEKSAVVDGTLTDPYAAYDLKKQKKELEAQLRDSRSLANQYGGGRASIEFVLRNGDYKDFTHVIDQISWDLGDNANEEVRKATENAKPIEKMLVHMTKTGVEMGFDAVVGTATGVGGLPVMFTRVFGQASQQANRAGASLPKQLLYGATVAGIEVLTEKIADLGGGLIYGKGFSGDFTKRLIHNLELSPIWEKVMYALADTVGEGLEEGASDLLGGIAEMIIRRNPDKGFWEDLKDLTAEQLADVWYDMLLGSAMGLVGAGGGAVTGQYRAEIEEQYNADLERDQEARYSLGQEYQQRVDTTRRNLGENADVSGIQQLIAGKVNEQESKDSSITRARRKMDSIANKYPNGNAPMEERLTRQEASMLIAAGYPRSLVDEMAIPRGTRLATAEEIAEGEQKRTKDIKGYVERAANTDITRRGAERGKDVDEAKAKAEKQKRDNDITNAVNNAPSLVDIGGTIDSGIKKTAAQNISGAEEQLGIAAKDGQSIPARLSAIENELGIAPENGATVTARIDAINKALYGENGAPPEIASNAPDSQVSSEGEITQEQTAKKVKPPKETKSKKAKKPGKTKNAKVEEQALTEETAPAETSEPIKETLAEEPPVEEVVEEAEEPTGLEAEIRNAKTLGELTALYKRDKDAFNDVYSVTWGGGFEIDSAFAKSDLENLFNDLHPEEETSSAETKAEAEPVAIVEPEAKPETEAEAETEPDDVEETPTEQRKKEALEAISQYGMTADEVMHLNQVGLISLQEIADAIGHKFSETTKSGKAKSQTELRRQVNQWYSKGRAERVSTPLTEKELKAYNAANKKKATTQKQNEQAKQERAQDKADKEAGLKKDVSINDFVDAIKNRIKWREPTPRDVDTIRQWMVDQITKGELTAEEISNLIAKNGHTDDVFDTWKALMRGNGTEESLNEKVRETYSQELIDLAASELTQVANENTGVVQTLLPNIVRENLIRGFNDLTGEDIGLEGSNQAKIIQEAIDNWRGKEAPSLISREELARQHAEQRAAREAARKKAEDAKRAEKRKENEDENPEEPIDRRRVPASIDDFKRLRRGETGRSTDSGESLALEGEDFEWDNDDEDAYRTDIQPALNKGAKFVSYDETDKATQRVVSKLLNGVNGDQNSRIPYVSIIDCSKMSKADFNKLVGAVGKVNSEFPDNGIILFVNAPTKVQGLPPGCVVQHEPVHYFVAKAKQADKSIDFDSLFSAAVDTNNKAQNITMGSEAGRQKKIDRITTSFYKSQLRFSGHDIISGYLAKGQTITEKGFASLLEEDDVAIDNKLRELTGENYELFKAEVMEEAVANIVSANPAMGELVNVYRDAMRSALYDSGLVPKGYFENLDSSANSFTKEQTAVRANNEKAAVQTNDINSADYIDKLANGLAKKGLSEDKIANILCDVNSNLVDAASRQLKISKDDFVKQAKDYFSQTKKASGTKKLIDPSTGKEVFTPHYKQISKEAADYWLSRNVTPEGAKDTITNKEYNKYTTEAERQRNGGSLEYTSVSEVSMAKTAGENLTNGISKYGYEAVVESYKSAERLNDLETKEVIMLAQMIDQELWYRSQHPGKTKFDGLANSNEILAADSKLLWDKARISKHESASNLRRNTVLTPELQTINNFIQTWAEKETPESIDQNSDAAKMIQFGQDTVARVQEIEEDFKAGNEEQAKKAMIDVIKEVNKVRNTRGLFADQLIGGKPLGKAMDFVEASLLNRVLKESDFNTIKMMALGSVNRINSDFEKVGKLNTINQLRYANMLSNFATTVNNLLNNLESATTGALANNIAYDLLNKKTTRIMGEQTLVRSNNDWFSRLAIRSEKRAKNKELNRYMWTKGAESVLSLMYGLDVDEGKIDLDLGAKHNQNSGELGQLMARYQFLTGLKMQTTDAMAIARAYKAMEININSLPISNERKAELRNLAMQEARTQMYHNEDNGVAKALLKARETLDKAHLGDSSLGLGSILVPFVQVPVNVATRALEATPAGVVFDLARGSIALHQLEVRAKQYSEYQDAFEAQKAGKELTDAQKEVLDKYANVRKPTDAEVHKAARAIGHAATNASIFAVALLATALKGLKNFDDEDDDELKRLAKEKGWTGLQINMAAMFRPGHEWKDGDPVVGGSWLEVLSIPFAAAYSVANSWMKEDEDGKKGGPGAALLAIAKSPLTTFSQAIDVIAGMPGVDQFYDMWTAYQNLQKYEPDEDKRIAKETASILQYGANTLASFVIPNSIAMGTAGLDNKVRDVYNADSNWQIMGNIIKNKLPGLRGTLPVARDSLGNVRTYGDNVLMGLVNKSVLPGTGVKIWSRSPLEKEWARLKGEGVGGNLMPKKSAPNNITVDGEKYDFNAEEKRSWDDMNTELCVAGQNILINTEGYKSMTDTEKGAALRDVNTLMALVSNQAALDKKGVDTHVELKGWEAAYFGDDDGPDMEGLAKYLVAKHTFKSIWDSKAGTFGNLEEADTFIDNIYSKLDQTARDTLDSSYGWLDDFSDARKTTGMSAKEFAAAKEIQEKYRDMQDAMRDMADDDENKESLSALSRNMATEFADYFGDGSKRAKWAQDHLRLWVTISASNETLEKWQGNTSLSTKEIDSWLDNKSKLVPQGGYKNPSQNQTFMAIRDFTGISASNQKDLEKKRWDMIKMAASKGEDIDGDGEGDGGAWAKLKPYMEQGYSVEYALDHATYWYKQGRRWVKRKYNRIYPKD